MAKVYIEERAFSDTKLARLSAALKVSKKESMGLLVWLWHDSQHEGKAECSKGDLDLWFAEEVNRGMPIIDALVKAGYVERLSRDCFRIVGNVQNICRVSAYKLRAKCANSARWNRPNNNQVESDAEAIQKVTKKNSPPTRIQQGILQASININFKESQQKTEYKIQNTELNSSSLRSDTAEVKPVEKIITKAPQVLAPWDDGYIEATGQPIETGHIRSSASLVQIEANTPRAPATRSRKKNAAEPKETVSLGTNEVIAEYVDLYKKKFGGTPPAIGPRNARAAKEVLKQFGMEKTKSLLASYLRMGDKWFATKHFDLVTFAGNLNAVLMFQDKGVSISSTMAKSLETHTNNEAVCSRLIARYGGQA